MARKLLLMLSFMVGGIGSVYSKDALSMQLEYKASLESFEKIVAQEAYIDYEQMNQLFLQFDTEATVLLRNMRKDIAQIKRSIKKDKNITLQSFYEQLTSLYRYIKQNRVNFNAIRFHDYIKNQYQKLFTIVADEQDVVAYIQEHLSDFKIDENNPKFLLKMLNKIRKDRHKISYFEDFVHADFMDLKLNNYVYKIDFVRLRNAILFDIRYKNQKLL